MMTESRTRPKRISLINYHVKLSVNALTEKQDMEIIVSLLSSENTQYKVIQCVILNIIAQYFSHVLVKGS